MNIKAKITGKKELVKSVWQIDLSVGEDFYFNAGQYVWVITNKGRRAYSITSSSKDKENISLIIKNTQTNIVKNGGDSYLSNLIDLGVGNEVELRGPGGSLRVPSEGSSSVYIAGGVGIAPFLGIVRSLKENNLPRKIQIFYFASTKEDDFCSEELKKLSKSLKGLSVNVFYGQVEKKHLSKINKDDKTNYFVVGSRGFVNKIDSVLSELKVPSEKVNYEENFPDVKEFLIEKDSNSIFKDVVDQSANHVVLTDANGIVIYANRSAEELTGFSFDEMKGQTPRLWGGLMDKEVYKSFWKQVKFDGKPFEGEFRNIKKNGEMYDVFATVSPIFDKDKNLIGFMGIEVDITESKRIKDELKKMTDLMIDKNIASN